MTRLASDIAEEMDLVLNETISRVITIAKRYDKTLSEIEKETEESREKVRLAWKGWDTNGNLSERLGREKTK